MSETPNIYNGSVLSTPFREDEQEEIVMASVNILGGRQLSLKESLAWVAVIFFLCSFDAIFTLLQIKNGASELNPLMNYLLASGKSIFLFWKFFISFVSLSVLFVYLPRYRLARLCFGTICSIYFLLFCYHVICLKF